MALFAGKALLTTCHYLFPIVIVCYFATVQISTFCCQPKTKPRKPTKLQKRIAICLSALIVLLFVGEAALYIFRALVKRGWWAPQDYVLYTILSVVVWGTIGVTFMDAVEPTWSAFLGPWVLGSAFEIIICALTTSLTSLSTGFGQARFTIQLLRAVSLCILAVGGVSVALKKNVLGSDEECQSLLSNDSPPAPAAKASYGAIATSGGSKNTDDEDKYDDDDEDDDDPDSEDEDSDIKKQQKKRLEDDGGWLGYLRGFLVFLPVLNPTGDRTMQFCYAVMGFFLIWHRFENVLLPNQLGIVTNKLAEVQGTGVMPWKEVAIWIFLRFLASSAGLRLFESAVSQRIDAFSYRRITEFAFNHVMQLSMDFHNNKDSGEVLKSVDQGSSVSQIIDMIVFSVGPALIDLVVAFGYITYLFDIYIALIVFVTGALYLWAGIRLRSLSLPTRRKYVKKARIESKIMYESISNWQTVAYFNRTDYEQERYGGALKEYLKYQTSYFDRTYVAGAVTQLILITGHLCVSYLAVYHVSQGTKPVGSFVTLVTYWGSLISPLSQLANANRRFSYIMTDAERLLQVIRTKPSITSKPGAPDLVVNGGEVVFKDVCFKYNDAKQILTDLNFTAKAGDTVAFVGETGGGKSTTLKLLFRYYDVSSGSITIDGQDIRDVSLDSIRSELGSVPQDPSMFNRSIMENVRYARLDATNDEVKEACKAAAIHDKIETFPKKYRSKAGERGVKLSGGELQRIAIARVLLKNSSIVLLDEATSAVDSSTEELIQESFRKLSRGRTTFVIAHRLSTIVDADQILVVDGGKIVERGTHNELLKVDGKYKELWLKQTKEHADMKDKAEEGVKSGATSATATASPSHVDLLMLDDKATEQTDGCAESKEKGKGKQAKNVREQEQDEEDDEPMTIMSPKPTGGVGKTSHENNDNTGNNDKDGKEQ